MITDFTLFEIIKNKILNGEVKPKPIPMPQDFKWDVSPPAETTFKKNKDVIEERLGEKKLNDIYSKYGDLVVAKYRDNYDNDNRYVYSEFYTDIKQKSIKQNILINRTFGGDYNPSGIFWYPPTGYCGWHTNSNNPGERIYVVWNEEDDKSFLRYKDFETGEIVTKWEKKGWSVNRFTIPKSYPFWHCIGSYTNRVAFGFRDMKNARRPR